MISEDALRQALEDVDAAILSSLPSPSECRHQFSARFERKMRTVKYRAKHPVVYKTVQRAACVLLAVLILFSSIMAFSTNVRAAVLDWIKEQFENFYYYFHTEMSHREEHVRFQLAWHPDGYILVDSYTTESGESAIYFHESGQIIQFSYMYIADYNSLYVGGKEYEHKVIQSNGRIYDIYASLIEGENNGIVWQDPENGILFHVSAPCEEDELIKLVENIIKKEEN